MKAIDAIFLSSVLFTFFVMLYGFGTMEMIYLGLK